MKGRTEVKIKLAYVVLAFISVLTSGASLMLSSIEQQKNDRAFCDVVAGVTSAPAAKPTDPAKDPSRERAYIWHEKFVRLGEKLGCDK